MFVRSFAERPKLHEQDLTQAKLDYMLGDGGNGISLELLGHGDAVTVPL